MNALKKVPAIETPWPSVRILAKGHLAVAIVTLPEGCGLAGPEDTFAERRVFFEAQKPENLAGQLQELLARAWCVDTSDWLEHGLICNVYSAEEAIAQGVAEGLPEELALFECGSGSESFGVGPDLIHYWRQNEIDLLVTPRVAHRLRFWLAKIEAMYREKDAAPSLLEAARALEKRGFFVQTKCADVATNADMERMVEAIKWAGERGDHKGDE